LEYTYTYYILIFSFKFLLSHAEFSDRRNLSTLISALDFNAVYIFPLLDLTIPVRVIAKFCVLRKKQGFPGLSLSLSPSLVCMWASMYVCHLVSVCAHHVFGFQTSIYLPFQLSFYLESAVIFFHKSNIDVHCSLAISTKLYKYEHKTELGNGGYCQLVNCYNHWRDDHRRKRKWFCLFDLPAILYGVDASGLHSFSTLMFLVPEIFCQTFLEPVQFYLRPFVKTFCTHFEFPINLQFNQNFMFCLPMSINKQWSYETYFYFLYLNVLYCIVSIHGQSDLLWITIIFCSSLHKLSN